MERYWNYFEINKPIDGKLIINMGKGIGFVSMYIFKDVENSLKSKC